jgi:hypothetical protein
MDAFDDTRLAATLDAVAGVLAKQSQPEKAKRSNAIMLGRPRPGTTCSRTRTPTRAALGQNQPGNINDFNTCPYPNTVPVI